METSQSTIIDLSPFYGLIRVAGPAALSFLQGQLTADIREITPTASRLAAYCNLKGRIRALFRIFQLADSKDYLLQLPRTVLPSALEQLTKMARFSKVTLEDISDRWQRIGIQGSVPTFPITSEIILVSIAEGQTTSPQRFEVLGPKALMDPIWQSLTEDAKIKVEDFAAWKLRDIRAGIPEIWPETREQFLPHNLNLPNLGAVSFTKGCYCGQEIVARMEYRGKQKRQLFHTRIPKDAIRIPLPTPGSILFNNEEPEKEMGTLITASQTENGDLEMLICH